MVIFTIKLIEQTSQQDIKKFRLALVSSWMTSVKKVVSRKGEAGEWAKNLERMPGLRDKIRSKE